VLVFHKLCRIAQTSGAHRTESVSAMDHKLTTEVSSGNCGCFRHKFIILKKSEIFEKFNLTKLNVYTLDMGHVSNATENVGGRWYVMSQLLQHTPAVVPLRTP